MPYGVPAGCSCLLGTHPDTAPCFLPLLLCCSLKNGLDSSEPFHPALRWGWSLTY